NVTEDVKKKANKGEFFVNIGDSLCTNCYNFVVQYDRNQKYNKKNDNKPFKRHESTENIATDNNNSLASIEELQNEITKLKKKIEALTMYSINEMTGTSASTIDTLSNLGFTTTYKTVIREKKNIVKSHEERLLEYLRNKKPYLYKLSNVAHMATIMIHTHDIPPIPFISTLGEPIHNPLN
ncbi:14448_t:CDS:2, partial [Entrophospora sp. SA101]